LIVAGLDLGSLGLGSRLRLGSEAMLHQHDYPTDVIGVPSPRSQPAAALRVAGARFLAGLAPCL
jgi:hypothetical protein